MLHLFLQFIIFKCRWLICYQFLESYVTFWRDLKFYKYYIKLLYFNSNVTRGAS